MTPQWTSPSSFMRALRRVSRLALIAGLTATAGASPRMPSVPGSAFGAVGAQPERGYFSTQPWDRVDLVSGNLNLTFTDLALPGNAGMDLRITRAYSQQAASDKWRMAIAGLPMAARVPASPDPPDLVMFDLSPKSLHNGVVSGYWVTTDFWRFDTSTRTLHFPNGWIATFYAPSNDWAWLHEVHDGYGNSITVEWTTSHDLSSVTQTVHDSGAANTRTVSFSYDGATSTMTYGNRVWTYTYDSPTRVRITSAQPPAGPAWGYAYTSTTMGVTTPQGGTVTYRFADQDGRSVVDQVTTGGRAVASGTWGIDYGANDTPKTTTVTQPSGRQQVSVHEWTEGPDGKQWVLTSRTLLDENATPVLHFTSSYTDIPFLSGLPLKVPNVQTITQDGVTYTTDFDYRSSDFGDYLQPNSISESASDHSVTRVTTRTFDAGFSGAYILPRVATTTVTIGSESFQISVGYDHGTGFVTSQTAAGLTTSFAPDSFGNVGTITDPHSHVTTTSYTWGVPATIETPAYTISRSINPDATIASETRNGHATGFTYDGLGRMTHVTPATGAETVTTYASSGETVTVSRDASWATTTVDGFGRPMATENAVGVRTTLTYDAEGRITFRSAPFTGSTAPGNTFDYDALGRVTTIVHPDSTVVRSTYSGSDVSITDENHHTTAQHWQRFGSPTGGRLTGVTDPAGQGWSYAYNVFGSLTRVVAPAGPDRVWVYNSANQLWYDTQPESGTTTYTYSGGLLASKTDALSRTSTCQYDSNDRLTQIVAPVSNDSVTFEYDDADNRTRMVTGGAETVFTYDAAERLASRADHINGQAFTTTYGYDDRDNLTTLTYPSGRVVQYGYDAANRATSVSSGSTVYAGGLTYHPSGALASATFGNTTTESLTLDTRFRPRHLVSGPVDLTYDYDDAGNVAAITDARASYSSSFSYDALDRLTSVGSFGATSFTYDALGNRQTKGSGSSQVTYSYSSATNQLTSASSPLGIPETGTFAYDPVGSMTTDGTGTYTYSSANLMQTSTVSGATTQYAYDAAGLRTVKASPSGVTYYVHGLGAQVLAEYDATTGAPVLAREYLYLGGRLLAAFAGSTPTPSVTAQITTPTAGLVTPADVPVTLAASASLAGSGSITSVQFYANGRFLGSDASEPYALTWTPTTSGSVNLTARAVASTGKIGHGPPVAVTVMAIGRVLGVSASPASVIAGQSSTLTVTGNAYACGAVQINFGDGTATTFTHSGALAAAPITTTHSWSTPGAKTVTATGQGDCQGEVAATVTVSGNTGPTVSLTAPTAGTYISGTAITLTASASDAQGVASVAFYDGETLLATDTAAPWTYNWTSASDGAHTVMARATDTYGASTPSSGVSFTVQDVESVGVSPSLPVAGQAATITVYGSAVGCGAVTVNYGDGDVVTYAIDGLPISNYHVWTTGGSKTVTATGQGNCSGSAQRTVTVDAPPSVSLTTPAANDTFYAPATITLTATASDSDGAVASVAFYAGSTLLATDTSAPYSYTWSSVTNGTYSLTAVATDTQGGAASSTAVSITVADPSASTVTGVSVSPTTAAVNTTVTVTVTGGNPCGAVQINFGDGDMPYLPIYGLPYARTHSYSAAGTYTITASGQGNCYGQASTSITITGTTGATGTTGTRNELTRGNRSFIGLDRPGPRLASRRQATSVLEGDDRPPERSDATFDAFLPTTVTVTLDLLPGASGTVTSAPSGFNCTGTDTTCTATFDANATVTLTATPASGQTFLGWGGACAGTSTCVVSAADGLLVTAAFSAPGSATITYYHTDMVGSVRAITDASGAALTRLDYFPFGESTASLTGDPKKFLGQDRDAETAFDYLGARYYRNVWGRFRSADDSAFMDPFEPQTFNRYAYVVNNPLRWVDPTGHAPQKPDKPADSTFTITLPSAPTECLWGCGVDPLAFQFEGLYLFWQGPRMATGQRLPLRLSERDKNFIEAAIDIGSALLGVWELRGAFGGIRALTAADFGAQATIKVLSGTMRIEGRVAVINVRNIEGNLGNYALALNALKESARAAGATTIRLEGTVANPSLLRALERVLGPAGRGLSGGPQDVWIVPLKNGR